MKKFLFPIMLVAATLVSCQKESKIENRNATVKLLANAVAPETKTNIESDYSISWASTGEEVALLELNSDEPTAADPFYYPSTSYTLSDSKNAQFSFELAAQTGTDFDYYAAYPKSAVYSISAGAAGYNDYYFKLPEVQTPSASSVDPAAAIIVASVENQTEQATSLNFQFAHAAAYGKMTLKGVQTLIGSENLQSITLSSAGKAISGGMFYYFAPNTTNGNKAAGTISPVPATKKADVIINTDNISLSDAFDAWFACWPFDLASGDNLTVSVTTDANTYTKAITMAAALSFTKGQISHFSVDMSTAAPEADLSGTYVILAEVSTDNFEALSGVASGTRLSAVAVTYDKSGSYTATDDNIVWTLAKSGSSYTATNLASDEYLAWTANGGNMAKTQAASYYLTLTNVTGIQYNIAATEDLTRILARNSTAANQYFAFYAGTQIKDLYLVPTTFNPVPVITAADPLNLIWTAADGTSAKTITVSTKNSTGISVTPTTDANFTIEITDNDATDGTAIITVTPKAAAGATERTLALSITATDGTNTSEATIVNLTQQSSSAPSTITDELTLSTFGVSGTAYTDKTGITATSSAVYSANMAGGTTADPAIQLRSKNNNSGIVSTTSGGSIKSVVITFNTTTTEGRVVEIYGSTSAYSAPTDLYDTAKQGTKINSATYAAGTVSYTIPVSGSYQYIGIRSSSGALYLDKISIEWEP